VLVEGLVLLSLLGEVWFLAKAWLVRLVVDNGCALVGRKEQFRPDFSRSLWFARSYTWRPQDFSQ